MQKKTIDRSRHGSYPWVSPKLIIRLMVACYQSENVPICFQTEDEMLEYALHKATSLGRKTCLVLGPDRAWYCEPDGSCFLSDEPPARGLTVRRDGRLVGVAGDGEHDPPSTPDSSEGRSGTHEP